MEAQTDNLLGGGFWSIISKCDSGAPSYEPLEGIGFSAVVETTLPASLSASSLGHLPFQFE